MHTGMVGGYFGKFLRYLNVRALSTLYSSHSGGFGGPPAQSWGYTCMQAHECPQHLKSSQDTLCSNFNFLHYSQILHCLKDPWWALGRPLSASGPILNVSVGSDDLQGHGKTLFILWLFSKVAYFGHQG